MSPSSEKFTEATVVYVFKLGQSVTPNYGNWKGRSRTELVQSRTRNAQVFEHTVNKHNHGKKLISIIKLNTTLNVHETNMH